MKVSGDARTPNGGLILLPVLSVIFLAASVASFTFSILLSRHRFDQSYQWAESLEPVQFWLIAIAAFLVGFTLALGALNRAVHLHRGRILASVAVLLYFAMAASYVVLQMRFNW